MAITASGLYGLTLEKFFIDTLGDSLEAEDGTLALVNDSHTPDFNAHNFADDLTNEISGGNYARDAVTSTEITIATGVLTYDAADTVFDNAGGNDVTISSAMAGVLLRTTGNDATAELIGLWDFVTAASCTNSTFTVQWNASGMFTLDFTP
jgi:hypothetical protein